jgi:hypothetical protein
MVDAASDPRARFVGLEAYINAGGQIDRDLFQPAPAISRCDERCRFLWDRGENR